MHNNIIIVETFGRRYFSNLLIVFNADYFCSLFDAKFSTNEPERKVREEAAFVNFMDFLEECEGKLTHVASIAVSHSEVNLVFWWSGLCNYQ